MADLTCFCGDSASLFNSKPQVLAHHDIAGLQSPAAAEPLTIDCQSQSRATPQFISLPHEQHLAGPIRTDDVAACVGAEQTRISQQHDSIDGL